MENWPEGTVKCINCGGGALVIVEAPAGCVVYPEARRMAVCAQHLNNWGFLEAEDGSPVKLISERFDGAAHWAGW